MKRIIKVFAFCVAVLILVSFLPETVVGDNPFVITAEAHGGRTDSHHGHKDNKNKSGLGSYHYHCGDYPAHLHKDGVCPYAAATSSTNDTAKNSITVKNQNSSTATATVDTKKQEKVNISDKYDNLVFCAQYYYENNADIQKSVGTDPKALYNHFVKSGMKEGRQAISTFNVNVYKEKNEDLAKEFGDDLPSYYNHYAEGGCKEDRICY